MTKVYDDGSVLQCERTPAGGWTWTLLLPGRGEFTGEADTFYNAREAARMARIAAHVRAWEAKNK